MATGVGAGVGAGVVVGAGAGVGAVDPTGRSSRLYALQSGAVALSVALGATRPAGETSFVAVRMNESPPWTLRAV